MPRSKEYENRIPAFYRRQTIDIMLFVHVTAIRERSGLDERGKRYVISIEEAIRDFFKLYCISEDEFPIENAMTVFHRVKANFIYTKIESSRQEIIIENQKKIIEKLTGGKSKLDNLNK